MQTEQHLNHYVQQEQVYFTSHLRNVESHLQAEVAKPGFTSSNDILLELLRLRLEQQHLRMLMLRCIGNSWSRDSNSKNIRPIFLKEAFNFKESTIRRALQETQHQRVLDPESGTASRQITQRERAVHRRNLAEQVERWRAHSLEIYDEGRAAISVERQEVEREIANQVQEHLARLKLRWIIGAFGMIRSVEVSMRWCKKTKMRKWSSRS